MKLKERTELSAMYPRKVNLCPRKLFLKRSKFKAAYKKAWKIALLYPQGGWKSLKVIGKYFSGFLQIVSSPRTDLGLLQCELTGFFGSLFWLEHSKNQLH